MASFRGFTKLPIEISQKVAALLEDKDLASFRAACKFTFYVVEGDGGSLWRRRFVGWFETPQIHSTGQRRVDPANIKAVYQERKSVLHVIDQIFQTEGGTKPKLAFVTGKRTSEKVALKVLRDLIIEAYSDKNDDDDMDYKSKNLIEVAEFTQKTNILKILGRDGKHYAALKPHELPHPATMLLYTIQCILTPLLFRFEGWHRKDQSGFHEAQMMAYFDNVTAPVLTGHSGQSVNMPWLLKNIQFWRHHFLTEGEPLSPYFEALEENELPAFWSQQLTQGTSELSHHWKGSYAYVDREEIQIIRSGKSGQGNSPPIQDKLNGEEDPDSPFQSVDLELTEQNDGSTWNRAFESHLNSLKTPKNKSRTRAQKSATGGPDTNEVDFSTSSVHFDGRGTDYAEDFHMEGWLNPLPAQSGVPGWQRVTMMKYFKEKYGAVDMEALWAYEGIMLPGGKIMIGRWWCPTDGTGPQMYSGPFVLWNVPCSACECECEFEDDSL